MERCFLIMNFFFWVVHFCGIDLWEQVFLKLILMLLQNYVFMLTAQKEE